MVAYKKYSKIIIKNMNILKSLIIFFDHPLFSIIGGLSFIFSALIIFYRLVCIGLRISPLVFRIGNALWRRKVAIIGNTESFSTLKDCIVNTGIFKKNNVIHIPIGNIEKLKTYTLLLVDWESSGNNIDEIFLVRKNHNTAVVIFAKPSCIPPEKMFEIANKSNTVVVNFKGRLLNDILSSIITTSFN